MKLSGTPANLDQAIEQALCFGPMSEVKERLYLVIKDYIANKIQPFMFEAHESKEQMLSDLFEILTKREPVEPSQPKPTPYWATQHGACVRVIDNSPKRRHGLVVQIIETAPEWIEPLVLWDGEEKPEKVNGYALFLEPI